jgi:hypothetical protein
VESGEKMRVSLKTSERTYGLETRRTAQSVSAKYSPKLRRTGQSVSAEVQPQAHTYSQIVTRELHFTNRPIAHVFLAFELF